MTALPASDGWQPQLLRRACCRCRQVCGPGRRAGRGDGGCAGECAAAARRRRHRAGGCADLDGTRPAGRGGSDDLAAALAGAGCAPEQIELVVLTHLDFDHCGGCLAAAAFTRGRSGRRAAGRRLRPGGDRAAANRRAGWTGSRTVGRLRPGSCFGRRPATAPAIRWPRSVASLVHLADLVHHRLHVQHPQWDRRFDSDVEVALATRLRVLDELARSGLIVTASHIAGAGRIVPAAGGGQRWQDA